MNNTTDILSNSSLLEMDTYSVASVLNFEPIAPVFQTHSLILSMFALTFTSVVGVVSSSMVLTALTVGKLLKQHHYILLTSLLIISILINVVWSPLEIICLLMYHSNNTLFLAMKDTAHTLYLLLMVTNAGVLALIALWFLFSLSDRTRNLKKYLTIIGLPVIVIISLSLAIIYGVISYSYEESYQSQAFYHILNKQSYITKLIILTIFITFLFFECMHLLALRMTQPLKSAAVSVASTSEHSITLPTLTPSDSGSEYRELRPKVRRKDSQPRSQLSVSTNPAGPMRTENQAQKKNSLALNSNSLLQMFGRRRHTICQIGEIGDNGYTEHQTRAQGYHYVRKFSVDITALQAQLEDPKSHSSMSSFKSAEDIGQNTFVPGLRSPSSIEEASTSFRPVLKKSSAPPRIMVQPVTEEELHQTIENKINEDNQVQNFKICLILLIAFIITVIPVYLTEAIRNVISLDSYVNSLICTTALSSIQTVIFPQVIIFTDAVVYKAVRRMLNQCCRRSSKDPTVKESQSMLPQPTPSDFSISQL